MNSLPPTPDADRAVVDFLRQSRLAPAALQVVLEAQKHLSITFGLALASHRYEQPDPLKTLHARVLELQSVLRQARDENAILHQRLAHIAPRHRPHYRPEERWRILEHLKVHALSLAEGAQRFLVTTQTLSNWHAEARRHPGRQTVGSLLKPVPPVTRLADVVRALLRRMHASGFGGNRTIARTLARVHWRVSPRSVARIRKEPAAPPPAPLPSSPSRTVQARYPNHVWMADLTEIPGLFRILTFQIALVLDVFSRMPLGARVFLRPPTAQQMLDLVEAAARRHGSPRHFVSDQGTQFTAELFKKGLSQLGADQRFGAIGKAGSIAIIERFWRALKTSMSLRDWRPLLQVDLEQRLAPHLAHYAYLRPHQSLSGAVPAEMYFGIPRPPNHPAPRGRLGEHGPDLHVEIAYLDEERLLPILVPSAA